ncbi:MAG: Ldh family oxidoreductase [Alphaproteobacteria bacterium]
MKVAVSDLREKVLAGVRKLGYQGDDAQIIANVLLYAQMRGNNQGISKIATGGVPHAKDITPLQLVKENKCGALFSGGHSMVSSQRALEEAISLAAKHGVGIVGTQKTETSSGAIGYFARQIAKAGYIGFITTGNGGFSPVAPYGSAEGKMGTNPLAYAIPYEGGEIVFDMATSAIAFFGIVEAVLGNKPLPENTCLDGQGNFTTDATKVMQDGSIVGAITTFGGYKGFGLSLFVQLMGCSFAGAGFPGGYEDDGSGTVIIAIDPGLLMSKEEFMTRARKQIDAIKAAKPRAGQQVTIPGERGDAIAAQAEALGEIEIADAVWNKLIKFLAKPN